MEAILKLYTRTKAGLGTNGQVGIFRKKIRARLWQQASLHGQPRCSPMCEWVGDSLKVDFRNEFPSTRSPRWTDRRVDGGVSRGEKWKPYDGNISEFCCVYETVIEMGMEKWRG